MKEKKFFLRKKERLIELTIYRLLSELTIYKFQPRKSIFFFDIPTEP